jgi:hypothetical protein
MDMIGYLAVSLISAISFKCSISTDPIKITSADGRTTVVATSQGKLLVYRKGSAEPKHRGRWSNFGHHQHLALSSDASTFVVWDEYAGMEIFDASARRIAFLDPPSILTPAEWRDSPGKWACHPEGVWLQSPKFKFQPEYLSFEVYSTRRVRVPTR